jgi:hypothetical protein
MQTHLNVQHHFITLRVGEAKGTRLLLTMSHSGQKASAAGVEAPLMKRAFKAFCALEKYVLGKSDAYKNYGEMMNSLKALAEKAPTIEAFVEAMVQLIEASPAGQARAAAAPKVPEDIKAKALIIEEVPAPAKGSGPAPRTREELQAAFDLVKNKKDWKERIDRVIPAHMEAAVAEAVSSFTGTQAYFIPHKDPTKLIVRAAGYYRGPCN